MPLENFLREGGYDMLTPSQETCPVSPLIFRAGRIEKCGDYS